MNKLSKFLVLVFSLNIFSPEANSDESFEGIVRYKIESESSLGEISGTYLTQLYGTEQDIYYKGGKTKYIYRDSLGDWEIYLASENKQYMKMKGESKIHIYDGADENRILKSFDDKPSSRKILGRKTRFLSIEYKDGTKANYWYDPSLYIDPKPFENLKFAYLYKYWSTAKSPYLMHEKINESSRIIYTAIKVSYKSLDDEIFNPHPNRTDK